MSAADILPWFGTLSIAVAALVIMAWPAGHRAYRADAADSVPKRCPLQRLMPMRDALYVDRFLDVNAEP